MNRVSKKKSVNALDKALELNPNDAKAYSYLKFVTNPHCFRNAPDFPLENVKMARNDLDSNLHNPSATPADPEEDPLPFGDQLEDRNKPS